MRGRYALLLWVFAACAHDTSQHTTASRRLSDCFGADSVIAVDGTHVGNLSLVHQTVGTLERACPNFGWGTTNGDEELDTAIVIERPGLRVVANIATLGDEEGFHRPVVIADTMPVREWKVSGAAGRLPGGVRLDATWAELSRVYGPLSASALNGVVYVGSCRLGGITVFMGLPSRDAPINSVNGERPAQAMIDSLMANQRIESVTLAPGRPCRDSVR